MTTTPDPRLLVPLAHVLDALPLGAPLWGPLDPLIHPLPSVYLGQTPGGRTTVVQIPETPGLWYSWNETPDRWALDLTPPDGDLRRVDGLDAGIRILGHRDGWATEIHRVYSARPAGHSTELRTAEHDYTVPPNVAPSLFDPFPLRLAVAAVLRDRVPPDGLPEWAALSRRLWADCYEIAGATAPTSTPEVSHA